MSSKTTFFKTSVSNKTLLLSGVRGTYIVDRTHVLVVERFSFPTCLNVFPQKHVAPVERNFAANCLEKTHVFKRSLQLTRFETLGGPLHKGTKRLHEHTSRSFQQNTSRCLFIVCFKRHIHVFPSSGTRSP